jgi:aspartyl-tRNA(Asn)/glutamyl-tRNA(Gln) amidotransferase subunit A
VQRRRVPEWAAAVSGGDLDTLRLSAEEALGLVERGEVSGRELWDAYRSAIDARNGELNAFLTVVDEPAGAGVPIALKDIISTSGIRTTAGSRILDDYVPVFDSTVAARCKAAGMPVLGKTNTDEFAMGSSTENSAYGPTHNPWDLTRVPGGSGGGSAAAVSAGLAPWALGSDTGGSVKLPAAFCGNVGLRPTYGTVSRYGVIAFASSLDQVGPVTRNVRDNALLYRIISGRDANDATTVEVPPIVLPDGDDLQGVRIGLPRQLNELDGIEAGVKASVAAAIDLASSLGAEIEECELPLSVDYGLPCYYLIAPAEASSNLARYDGVRYGLRSDGEDFREMVMNTRHDGFGDEPKRRIMLGTYALSSGYYDAYYRTAQKVRTVIKREHDALFERFDVLISPTCATTAFPLGAKAQDPLAMYLTDVLTIPSNMAGLPSLSIPCGLSDGLPVGLQLIGPQFSESSLYRVSHALELALDFDLVPGRLR